MFFDNSGQIWPVNLPPIFLLHERRTDETNTRSIDRSPIALPLSFLLLFVLSSEKFA